MQNCWLRPWAIRPRSPENESYNGLHTGKLQLKWVRFFGLEIIVRRIRQTALSYKKEESFKLLMS